MIKVEEYSLRAGIPWIPDAPVERCEAPVDWVVLCEAGSVGIEEVSGGSAIGGYVEEKMAPYWASGRWVEDNSS